MAATWRSLLPPECVLTSDHCSFKQWPVLLEKLVLCPSQVLSLCSRQFSITIFPVKFPVMCSLILDQRRLDFRVMGSQIKKFSFFYFLLLHLASALEVKNSSYSLAYFSAYLVRKILSQPSLPTSFLLHSASLLVFHSHLCLSQRGPLWPLKLKDNFFLLFF